MNQDFYEIYDFYYPAWWTNPWAQISLVLLIVLLLGFIIFLIIKRKRRPLLPWEWANQQLKKASPKNCKSKDDFKKFYYTLTSILKQYFQARFFWPTREKTDEELMVFLKKQNLDNLLYEYAAKIFTGASWIKFANEDVIKSQAQDDLEKALAIIKKTEPIELEKK